DVAPDAPPGLAVHTALPNAKPALKNLDKSMDERRRASSRRPLSPKELNPLTSLPHPRGSPYPRATCVTDRCTSSRPAPLGRRKHSTLFPRRARTNHDRSTI